MHGYQIHATALAACRLITSRNMFSTSAIPDLPFTIHVLDGNSLAVPDSPGRARYLHPYPSGRCRRGRG